MERAIHFWKNTYHKSQSTIFRSKITDMVLDPVNRALFGASEPAIDWEEVISKRLCVLIDTSGDGETDDYMCGIKMQWVFRSLIGYIRRAGRRRQFPVSIYIDELSSMYEATDDVLSRDINVLVNGIARNYNIWLTLAHQEMYQFDEKTQKTLMSMGTQIIGNTEDPDAAMRIARRYNPIDPLLEKRRKKNWVSSTSRNLANDADGKLIALESNTEHFVIDEDPVEYSLNEQLHLSSYKYMDQEPFHFFVRLPGTRELQEASTEDIETETSINLDGVELVKNLLMRGWGRKISDIEAEIEARLKTPLLPTPPAKILEYEAPRDDIPVDTTKHKEVRATKALGKSDTEIGERHDLWEEI